ncbi:HNH endonuclease signature motif containing protein [Alkanindiges illinoisensis]|uniref:HNH endonuclease signature motif containing protein n=1 Tax=Alkanindiges illinoisensis TaxID=197183 RepID=UPI00047A5A4B|nr:HNH endonuclease signature motif containing protein [Alkanindiges illinoisensis]
MPKGFYIQYTAAQLEFIEQHKEMERHALTALVNQQFGTAFTYDQIKGLCTRKGWKTGRTGCFAKGMKTWNKGMKGLQVSPKSTFKKGNIPATAKPVGHERIDRDGYVYAKVEGHRRMVLKHHYVWEKVNGAIPKGHIIAFKDGDKLNCSLENLVLVKRGVMAIMNHKYSHEPNPDYTPLYLNMARIDHRVSELRTKPCKS